jgi:hypothetical protein
VAPLQSERIFYRPLRLEEVPRDSRKCWIFRALSRSKVCWTAARIAFPANPRRFQRLSGVLCVPIAEYLKRHGGLLCSRQPACARKAYIFVLLPPSLSHLSGMHFALSFCGESAISAWSSKASRQAAQQRSCMVLVRGNNRNCPALATWRILDRMRLVAASFEAMLRILPTTYRVRISKKTPMLFAIFALGGGSNVGKIHCSSSSTGPTATSSP